MRREFTRRNARGEGSTGMRGETDLWARPLPSSPSFYKHNGTARAETYHIRWNKENNSGCRSFQFKIRWYNIYIACAYFLWNCHCLFTKGRFQERVVGLGRQVTGATIESTNRARNCWQKSTTIIPCNLTDATHPNLPPEAIVRFKIRIGG